MRCRCSLLIIRAHICLAFMQHTTYTANTYQKCSKKDHPSMNYSLLKFKIEHTIA